MEAAKLEALSSVPKKPHTSKLRRYACLNPIRFTLVVKKCSTKRRTNFGEFSPEVSQDSKFRLLTVLGRKQRKQRGRNALA
jgi:hypothetical protein